MLNVAEAKPVTETLLNEFYNAGKEFSWTNTISDDAIKKSEKPMIPMEAYVSIANQQ